VFATKTLLQFLERKYKREYSFIEKRGLNPNWASSPIPPSFLSSQAKPTCGPSHLPVHRHPPLVGKQVPGAASAVDACEVITAAAVALPRG
jgi:hypothetical protein